MDGDFTSQFKSKSRYFQDVFLYKIQVFGDDCEVPLPKEQHVLRVFSNALEYFHPHLANSENYTEFIGRLVDSTYPTSPNEDRLTLFHFPTREEPLLQSPGSIPLEKDVAII